MPAERSVKQLLDELGSDPVAVETRRVASETVSAALAQLGQVFWVAGAVVGPDRRSGASPFKFGDDRAVGIATVMQMGGELAKGAIRLLGDGNEYAASALVRQLVEVEYLAHAFAMESAKAAEWLRSDRSERLRFWSAAKLRDRSDGVFIASDYWEHCERGGHPTTAGMELLPGHVGMGANYVWVDMVGHLASIWGYVEKLAGQLLDGPVPEAWMIPDAAAALAEWKRADGLYAALGDLSRRLKAATDGATSEA